MHDFFDQQEAARRRTRTLVLWFVVAVAAIISAVYLVALIFWTGTGADAAYGATVDQRSGLWQPELFALCSAAVLLLVGTGSLYKMLQLREGGEAVARMLGGKLVDPSTEDPVQRRLLNVVEEMAIASGVPVPPVYLLQRETAINAFAAGTTTSDAVIGVTRGCLELLDRDELQGVIAHEFSHILNGDMRLNLRLMGVVHGILVLALTGWWMIRTLRFSSGDRRAGGALAAVAAMGLVLVIVGWIGVFFGRLIKSSVSRQREFLADASAVQFTRQPGGLAGALLKVGGLNDHGRVRHPRAEEASHLYFADGLRARWLNALSTHPPIGQRVQRLQPNWSGNFPPVEPLTGGFFPQVQQRQAAAGAPAAATAAAAGLTGAAMRSAAATDLRGEVGRLSELVGRVQAEHVQRAELRLQRLPESLRVSLREPTEAEAVIYSLMLDADDARRTQQLKELEQRLGERAPATFRELSRARGLLREVDRTDHLTLVDLAVPALRNFSAPQFRAFQDNLRLLATGTVERRLFEYALQRLVARHLEPHFGLPEPHRVAYYNLRAVADEVAILLAALAHAGQVTGAAEAFAVGAAAVDLPLELVPEEGCRLEQVDSALRRLAQLAPRLKRDLVRAMGLTVAHDRRVDLEEAELLRAICDALDCPVPPFPIDRELVAAGN